MRGQTMTNYNKRIDEILADFYDGDIRQSDMGKAKQAIASLIEELVAEARTEEQDKELRENIISILRDSKLDIVDDADAVMQLITADRKRVALEARINERNKIALDNYRGKTFSESTNWQAKFGYFVEGNERRIAELKAQQEEV